MSSGLTTLTERLPMIRAANRLSCLVSSPVGLILVGVLMPIAATLAVAWSQSGRVHSPSEFPDAAGLVWVASLGTAVALIALGIRWFRAVRRPDFFSTLAVANVAAMAVVSIGLLFVPLAFGEVQQCGDGFYGRGCVSNGAPGYASMVDVISDVNREIWTHHYPVHTASSQVSIRYVLSLVAIAILSVTIVPALVSRFGRSGGDPVI